MRTALLITAIAGAAASHTKARRSNAIISSPVFSVGNRPKQFYHATSPKVHNLKPISWDLVPRGGSIATNTSPSNPDNMITVLLQGLAAHMKGLKSDTIALLLTTALVGPICKGLGISNILGFLAAGMTLGPNGIKGGLVSDVHRIEMLADLGIVFFLFEMGLHINFETLMSMKTDVFGLGLAQVLVTSAIVSAIASMCGASSAAMVVLGGGIALSSSAFVLQLLKDKKQLETRHGRSSLGVLILQDLAVVPLLVMTPLLAGDGELVKVLASTGIAFVIALSILGICGNFLFDPLFDMVVSAHSQEAFVGLILFTVLGMSFLTEGLGLSNTLGPFVSGMILAASKHKEKIEAEISPFRGILIGLFFFSVGFEIDLGLISSKFGLVMSIVGGIMALKAAIISGLCKLSGLTLAESLRAGLLLCEVSEFAFVAFRMARSYGILDDKTTKLMLTVVSLTMALTPLAEELGAKIAAELEP